MTEENRCGSCVHWHQTPSDPMNLAAPRTGLCRAVPPVPVVTGVMPTVDGGMQPQAQALYPLTLANSLGCGMFKERANLTLSN